MAEKSARVVYSLNGLEIDFASRELRSGGVQVPIGSRAFEILEILAHSAGKLVGKYQLMEQVWPGAIVEENTLQFHISAIRKALGADRHLLKTVSGRGYQLLGSWEGAAEIDPGHKPAVGAGDGKPNRPSRTNIPIAASTLIGREALGRQLVEILTANRVVTLTGPGGIGKSVLALEVARTIFAAGGRDCWLVELASVFDPALVPAAVSVALGLRIEGQEISAEVVARALGEASMLLVLDNCEHLIEAAATLVETIVRICPNVSVLATSQETLRIEAEYACRIPPLEVPPPGDEGRGAIDRYSAVALFNTRLTALGASPSGCPEDGLFVSAICQQLDGIPLAIEFAAARVATLGLRQTAALLSDRFSLLTSGRRMALPRHQTLRATLDWSYELLPEAERTLLCRVAICAGGFTLEAATAIMGNGATPTMVADGIASLTAKSLVSLDASAASTRWRLLESIRAYALSKLAGSGSLEEVSRRHAEFFRDWFAPVARRPFVDVGELPRYVPDIDNMRAALDWAFRNDGDNIDLGIGLAAGAGPVLFAMSMLPECHRWSNEAFQKLDGARRGGPEEMHLQANLGFSLMLTHGLSWVALASLDRSLAIADERGDILYQMSLLAWLNILHTRNGNAKAGLEFARRSFAVASAAGDVDAIPLAHFLLANSRHVLGEITGCRAELDAALDHRNIETPTNTAYAGFDHNVLTRIYLANTLCLQGFLNEAIDHARKAVEDAQELHHPIALSIVLRQAILLYLWIGDLPALEELIDWYASNARSHALAPQVVVGRALKGELAIRRGDTERGVEILRGCSGALRNLRYNMIEFDALLAEGLAALGRDVESMGLINDRIHQIEVNGDAIYLPELLRLKGAILAKSSTSVNQAALHFNQSLSLCRQQGARVWELRTATDMTKLLAEEGRRADARLLLAPVVGRFEGGLKTDDVRAAEQLLATLQ